MPKIKLKRGLKANLPVLDESEPGFTTDTEEFFVGGANGNVKIAKQTDLDVTNVQVTNNTNALNNLVNVNPNAELLDARGTYSALGNRLNASDLSLAQRAMKKQLPMDITDYGAVGDGTTDCLAAFNSITSASSSDVSSRITDTALNVDSNNDGIADNWTVYTDGTITGDSLSITDGQQIAVTSSTGAGGKAIYQDIAVTPGEILNLSVSYKSTVTNGTFIPFITAYATGGTQITSVNLTNSATYTNGTLQITVPSGVTSIRVYLMARAQVAGDTGTATFKNVTLSKPVDTSKKVIKFPQNDSGNAVYYFSANPDLSNKNIDADKGVKLSFSSTNGVSFKTTNFVNNIDIISRDRNNTGTQFANSYSKLLFSALSENPVEIGMKKPRFMSDSEFNKIAYYTNSTTTTNESIVSYDSTGRNLYKVSNTAQPQNVGKIQVLDFAFKSGSIYSCLAYPLSSEPNGSSRFGVTFAQDGGNFLYYSVDNAGYLFKGLNVAGVWTETTQTKYTATNLTPAYYLARPFLMGARVINANTIEIYINGVLVDTVTVSFNATRIGFGINTVNATGAGILNIVWGQITETPILKGNIGDVLNIAVFGDSITFGEGAFSWAEFIPQILEGYRGITKVNVDNKAVSGQNSSQQLTTMQSYNFTGKDTTLILIGTNDIQQGVSASTYQSNVQSMINLAAANGKKVILGIPPMFISQSLTGVGFADSNYDYGAQIRAMVLQLVAQNSNVYLADTLSELGRVGTDSALYMLRDNLHPNAFGEVLLAKCFARSIVYALTNDMIYTPNTPTVQDATSLLSNGWVNFGTGYSNAGYLKTAEGMVKLSGLIKSGTVTSGTMIFNLPAGYRPSGNKLFSCATSSGSGDVEVDSNGNVVCSVGDNTTWLSLENIHFLATQ